MSCNNKSDENWHQLVCDATGDKSPLRGDTIQTLWSGFGSIFEVKTRHHHVIVKHVSPPTDVAHPRGWQSDFATLRKHNSYSVERLWYRQYSTLCDTNCRVPEFLGDQSIHNESWLLLEDLNHAGFPKRRDALDFNTASICLDWLAHFHARFMGTSTEGLWPVGSYWHLDTRPDEFKAMKDGPIKQNAHRINDILNRSRYQSLVHGDAKVANFCFSSNAEVAMVDFQYVGGGTGMKDVAYFIGSCFTEDECEDYADDLLNHYFDTLKIALSTNVAVDFQDLQNEWRLLYPLAWTDFYRFLLGWMPTHKKIHRYTKKLADHSLQTLHDFE